MGVISKWVGWFLALCAALFIIASCQAGAFDKWTNDVKVPSVEFNK